MIFAAEIGSRNVIDADFCKFGTLNSEEDDTPLQNDTTFVYRAQMDS